MLVRFTSVAACIALLSTSVNAYGMIAQVVDSTNFCVFLPPDDATDRIISDSEWNANAFCMGSTPLAKNAGTLPSGFIKSAHYVKTDTYVQVTGQMDYTKANLVGTDGGGQMDIKAPVGSSCAGWSYYVNLIEPESNTYCMRCCNDTKTCNRGISEKGCAHIIPGDYSGPNDGTGSGITSSADSTSTTTHTTTVTTTTTAATTAPATTAAVTTAAASTTVATTTSQTTVESTTSETTPSATTESVAPATTESASTTTTESMSSSTASGSVTATQDTTTADSVPSEDVSAQSVSGASSNTPMKVAIGAGLLACVVTFA